jgi:micrococcal nuclease
MFEYKLNNILKIVDGDTVDVSIDLGFNVTTIQRIRLSGVDTPETNSKNELEKSMGNEAKMFIINWVSLQKQMKIKTYKDDKYGRILGEIFGDNDQCINNLLIEKGYLLEKRKNNG